MNRYTLILLASSLALPVLAQSQRPLSLDELFPEKSYSGAPPRALSFSEDDRYVAFLWKGSYDEKGGADLWVWDTKEKKSKRLTTIDTFAPFDKDIPAAKERYKKEREEDEKRKKLSIEERNRLEREDAEKREKETQKEREARKSYPGISELAWAHKSHTLLFVYKGDLYKLGLDDKAPKRLTKTRDGESDVRFSKDDVSFTFRRGEGLYQRRFDSPDEEQLNPELPQGISFGGYVFSPDEKRLLVLGFKSGPPAKQVSYISYRERFAQAKTASRSTGEDPWANESYVYVYNLDDDKPWEAFKLAEAGDLSINDKPFSPDGKKVVFSAWKRDKRELQVHVLDLETKKDTAVFTDTMDGEHTSPRLADPLFTPDGGKVCLMSEKSGFRHPWLIDPITQSANAITRGNFEMYPIRFSEDGKTLYARGTKEDSSRMDLYRVEVATGAIERISEGDGRYSSVDLAHKGESYAGIFAGWKDTPELVVSGTRVSDSHSAELKPLLTRLTPERFTFKNRQGMEVQGLLYTPPGAKKDSKRPLLVYVYGGPLGDSNAITAGQVDRFGVYCAEALGYYYAIIDPRGTTGYGAAFGKANYEQPGVPQVEDLTDGVKHLTAQHAIDPVKVGIHGWSFGGFQTQMCLYTAPDTFHLGIAGAGPTEWQNYNNWYVGGVIGANKKPEELDKYSLTRLAKNLKGKLMLLHGLEDTNVLAQDTIHVYQSLLKAGKGPQVELVLDPTGGHGLGGDIKNRERYAIYAGYLERHWGRYSKS
jgi:dipeptidyl-peptidase 4